MNIADLLTILRIIIDYPELIDFTSEDTISGVVRDNSFKIKICCGGSGVVLILSDNSEVNFDLYGKNKEAFHILFDTAREQSKKYNYNKLLEELNRYENSSNTFNNHQSVKTDDLSIK